MTALELRSELRRILDTVPDTGLLEALRSLLQHRQDEDPWKQAMIERALEANEEIKAGKGMSVDEAFDGLIGKDAS